MRVSELQTQVLQDEGKTKREPAFKPLIHLRISCVHPRIQNALADRLLTFGKPGVMQETADRTLVSVALACL